MSVQADEVRQRIRAQLKQHLPPDTGVDELGDDSPLVTAGLLDSVAALKLVDHLEETYGIEFDPEELSADFLDTVTQIAALVCRKAGGA